MADEVLRPRRARVWARRRSCWPGSRLSLNAVSGAPGAASRESQPLLLAQSTTQPGGGRAAGKDAARKRSGNKRKDKNWSNNSSSNRSPTKDEDAGADAGGGPGGHAVQTRGQAVWRRGRPAWRQEIPEKQSRTTPWGMAGENWGSEVSHPLFGAAEGSGRSHQASSEPVPSHGARLAGTRPRGLPGNAWPPWACALEPRQAFLTFRRGAGY